MDQEAKEARPKWGANNAIPKEMILKMNRVPITYKKSYLGKLNGYMCDRCGKVDLGRDTKTPDTNSSYLYWLETGNQPFDGAVCCECFTADPVPKRVHIRKKKV